MLKTLLDNEISYFRKLSPGSRSLLISFIVYDIGSPLFDIFSNAYIWRTTQNISAVALYNLGLVITIPLVFFINGSLLKKISVGKLYALGLLLMSSSMFLLLFVQNITLPIIFIDGIILGISTGIYWGNRNLLTLRETTESERNYFNSLELAFGIAIGLTVPLIFGFVIDIGVRGGLIGAGDIYKILLLITVLILLFGSWYVLKQSYTAMVPAKIFRIKASRLWNYVRVLTLFQGISDGILLFFSTLVILYFLGAEATLGLVQSLSAVVTVIVLYTLGKKSLPSQRLQIVKYGVGCSVLAAIAFIFLPEPFGTLGFLLLNTLGVYVTLNGINVLILQATDTDHSDHTLSYVYVADRELCLNIGRMLGIGSFLVTATLLSNVATMRVAIILIAVPSVMVYLLATKVRKILLA